MTREATIEDYLVRQAQRAGGLCEKLKPFRAGIPDRLLILPGAPLILVEVKKPKGGVVSAVQAAYHQKLARMGHTVELAYTKGDVDRIINQHRRTGS